MREIDILKILKHTSHIKLLETFETAKHYLIVMELCPGGDLLKFVKKRRWLEESQAKFLFKQLMLGVAYMHKSGVVHRDLKLENILLDSHGNIKIGDFGVSRRILKDQTLFEQCGTPTYIAPEVMSDAGYKGFPVDIWSAGICLFAILHGHVPLEAYELDDLTPEFFAQKIDFCEDELSSQILDLIKGMLTIDVAKRLTAEEVLHHPWFDDV